MPDFGRVLRAAPVGIVSVCLMLLYVRQCNETGAVRRERDALAQKLAESERTIEVQEGVFQRTSLELSDVRAMLGKSELDLQDVRELLRKQDAELVAVTEISLRWKKKYEGLAHATQVEVPADPSMPDAPTRVRVDFSKELGPFDLSGHTLTSPPEAFVSLSQARPISLGVHIAQLPNGKWSSVVTTPDGSDYAVDIVVSAVDREFERQDWRDKLSLDLDAGFYNTPSLGVGARYGSAISVGPKCSVHADHVVSWSCGVAFSWRPFDK